MTTILRRVCGVVLLRDDGAALLQLRDDRPDIQDPAMWVFPGGHVEDSETLEAAARREFQEETEYVCGELRPVLSYRGEDIGYRADFAISFFGCAYDGVQHVVCHEGQCLRFVPRSELSNLSAPRYMPEVWDQAIAVSHNGTRIL
jgi:8-oxo-dGTP diphosphatase